MRMRIATFARDGIDSFHVFRAEVVEHLADDAHGFVLTHAGFHGPVEFIVGRIDLRRSMGE